MHICTVKRTTVGKCVTQSMTLPQTAEQMRHDVRKYWHKGVGSQINLSKVANLKNHVSSS